MSCGMPCWNCQKPIPEDRHKLNAMKRVFCSDECASNFRNQRNPDVEEM